jgi:hypothetical protein
MACRALLLSDCEKPARYTYKWGCDGITSCSSLPSNPTLTDPGNGSVSVQVTATNAVGPSLPARSKAVTAP